MTVTLPKVDLVSGCQLVATPALDLLLRGAPIAVANRRVICIDGHSGAGKTNSLEVLKAASQCRVVTVKLDDADTHKGVVQKLCEAINPAGHRVDGYVKDLMVLLHTLLNNRALIVMVDEAQKAPIRALELVRTLHEHPTSRFGLVLSGVGMERHIQREPMLWSRVGLVIRHQRLSGRELVDFLHRLHPVFAGLGADLLVTTDEVLCRGDLRKWVILAEWLLAMTGNGAQPATEEHLRLTVQMVGAELPA